jgi:hypothetical protein
VKNFLLYLLVNALQLLGLVVTIYGLLLATGVASGSVRDSWWRVASGGMILLGVSVLPIRNSLPDYVPQWVQRWFFPGYVWFWITLGVATFVISWL